MVRDRSEELRRAREHVGYLAVLSLLGWPDIEEDTLSAVCLSLFSDRQQRVWRLRWGFDGNRPMTLEEVGRDMGVTRERIRQIEAQCIAKLRKWLSGDPVPGDEPLPAEWKI